MSYIPNVPVSGQSLGNSRPTINSNFTVLQTAFDENHVDFNSTNAGFHTFVDLQNQGTTPSDPPTGTVSHYSNLVNGLTEWFFQRENSGSVIQMSAGAAGIPSAMTSGRTFLPGGIILLWGTCNYSTTSSPNQNFQGAGFPTACFGMVVTPTILPAASAILTLSGVPQSATIFKVVAVQSSGSSSASPGGFYFAIGN